MRLYSLVFEQSGHGASRQHLLLMPKELTKAAALTSSDDMKTCAACSLAELRLVLLQTCHWNKHLDELSHHFNRAHGMGTCHTQDLSVFAAFVDAFGSTLEVPLSFGAAWAISSSPQYTKLGFFRSSNTVVHLYHLCTLAKAKLQVSPHWLHISAVIRWQKTAVPNPRLRVHVSKSDPPPRRSGELPS